MFRSEWSGYKCSVNICVCRSQYLRAPDFASRCLCHGFLRPQVTASVSHLSLNSWFLLMRPWGPTKTCILLESLALNLVSPVVGNATSDVSVHWTKGQRYIPGATLVMPLSLLGGTFLVVFPLLHFAQFPCGTFPRAPAIQATLTCDKTFYACVLRSLMTLILFTVTACQSTACLAVSYHGEHAHYVTTSRTHLSLPTPKSFHAQD